MYKAFVHVLKSAFCWREVEIIIIISIFGFQKWWSGSRMMHLGLYNLVWGQTEPIFWFEIPNSLSYVLSIALFPLLSTTQTHTLISMQAHAHIHQFKWNLGCLICFKTNLKAIYIILSWVREKLLLEKSVITEVNKRLFHSQDRTNHAVPNAAQEETPNLRTCTQLRLSGKAMEIRKPWSPFKGSASN